MKFIDFFAGIGGFRRGMELAGHECVGFCEFDKFAVASYTSMHLITAEQREYLETLSLKQRQKEILKEKYRNGEWYANDIRTVDAKSMPRAECWCFGFPCQDISAAGKRLGFQGHRSSLFFAVTKLIRELEAEDRPKYLFIENVKNLLSVNGGFDFAKLLIELDEIGYDAEWEVINSKDHGVPQNRERVFIIGHLRGRSGRKVFPLGTTNGENSNGKIITIGKWNGTSRHTGQRIYSSNGIYCTLTTKDHVNDVPKIAIPVLTPSRTEKRQNGRRFKENGDPMFTLTSQDRHGVMIAEATKKGYAEAYEGDSINLSVPGSKTCRGRVGKGVANTLDTSCNQGVLAYKTGIPFVDKKYKEFVRKEGYIPELYNPYNDKEIIDIAPTLTTQCSSATNSSTVLRAELKGAGMRIRKLTPKECFRLQGWEDTYFERAQFVNSDSQLYKQAGNGVTVNVIRDIAIKF